MRISDELLSGLGLGLESLGQNGMRLLQERDRRKREDQDRADERLLAMKRIGAQIDAANISTQGRMRELDMEEEQRRYNRQRVENEIERNRLEKEAARQRKASARAAAYTALKDNADVPDTIKEAARAALDADDDMSVSEFNATYLTPYLKAASEDRRYTHTEQREARRDARDAARDAREARRDQREQGKERKGFADDIVSRFIGRGGNPHTPVSLNELFQDLSPDQLAEAKSLGMSADDYREALGRIRKGKIDPPKSDKKRSVADIMARMDSVKAARSGAAESPRKADAPSAPVNKPEPDDTERRAAALKAVKSLRARGIPKKQWPPEVLAAAEEFGF